MAVAKLQGDHKSKRYDNASTPRCNVFSLSSASMSISREDEARTSSSESSSLAILFLDRGSIPPIPSRFLHPSNLRIAERVPNSASALAMSSCAGLLPAPDDHLGSSPSIVHHCRMSWASASQSGHVPSARTCNTAKFLQLELAAHPSSFS
ncbi:hypothetical protein PIB30_035822 [Stylosanthes scabra]|uniref:Uncharacterized protein n=1 Tax=Stylosanthes scabra TaxID=79078 RepID=A0ABU6YAG8_9FABA|nr:hypothetical protein [Stylosanthes scabra]